MAGTPTPEGANSSLSPAPETNLTAAIDRTLVAFGFEHHLISPQKVTGRFKVTKICCQPFDVLHGGVSALVAESMASLGAYVASGFRRIAGVQLCTNHIRPALLGEVVEAEARPVQVGRTIQVWEVQLSRIDPSNMLNKELISTSRVTILSNIRGADELKDYQEVVKKYAKL